MIYGYNSKLSSHGIDTIMDYGRELLEELKQVRNTKEVGGVGSVRDKPSLNTDTSDPIVEAAASLLHRARFRRDYFSSCKSLVECNRSQELIQAHSA